MNRTILFRRIAALLLFALLLLVFAALFFYKIVPDNQSDLNQRGHKVLTQEVQNFLRKDQDFHNIIENAGSHFMDLAGKRPPYDRLYANLPYDSTSNPAGNFRGHLLKTDTGAWLIVHSWEAKKKVPAKAKKDRPPGAKPAKQPTDSSRPIYLTVKMKDFADPLFAGQNDVFKDYLILLDTADSAGTGEGSPMGLSLLYEQAPLSASARFNADTTRRLAPNSDQSGTFLLSMAGEQYVAYFSRFEFHLHHLVLLGLIDKNEYDRKVNATPQLFLPLVIILICLAFIALPFLKVFLLSARECINRWDVLKMALSFYAGGVAMTIIVFYFFLSYVTGQSLQARLRHFSALVSTDVAQEIGAADKQLKRYDELGGDAHIPVPLKCRLATDSFISDSMGDLLEPTLDGLCIPRADVIVSRLGWLNDTGGTIGKWSPFQYPTPFTSMRNYVFFRLLKSKPASYEGIAGVDVPVVYTGKSNLTDEFQTFIARKSTAILPVPVKNCTGADTSSLRDTASFILIAAMLRATIHPVIPPGFGFSIIDNDGVVLVDGDTRKSLASNLFEESEENPNLLKAVRFDKTDWQFPIEIRGVSYFARVAPIAGQPLHLVCYYSRDIVRKNVNRMMHFSIQTLVLLWVLLAICLLLSTFHQWKPVMLKFNSQKVEWIRPASNNKSLVPISSWLLWLAVVAVVCFLGVGLASASLMPLFYLSLVLPFYTVLGVQVFHEWKGQYYSMVAIVLLNALVALLICNSGRDWYSAAWVLGLQVMAVAGLITIRRRQRRNPEDGEGQPGNSAEKHSWFERLRAAWKRNEYFRVLYLSISLISILPTIGILNYAFFAEKVQFKKEKLDVLSAAFAKRSNYLVTNLIPSFKEPVRQALDADRRERLFFKSSIYLTDRDTIMPVAGEVTDADTTAAKVPLTRMPDALYCELMDGWYFAPIIWGDEPTIPDGGESGHGLYTDPGDTAVLYAPGRSAGDPGMGVKSIVLRSHLQKPHSDLLAIFFWVGLWALLLLVALLLLAAKLLRGAINHLFLIEIVENIKPLNKPETGGQKGKTAIEQIMDGFTPTGSSWMPEVNALFADKEMTSLKAVKFERSFAGWTAGSPPPPTLQTDYILAMTDYLTPVYKDIFWNKLSSDEERYILYDFARDRYTNYKNSVVLHRLISKGVLVPTEDDYLDVFSLSFRQFVLTLPEGEYADAMIELQRKYRVPGTWESVRAPAIAILLVLGVFLFTTQPQISTFLAGLAVLVTYLTTVLTFVRSSFPAKSKEKEEAKDEKAAKG